MPVSGASVAAAAQRYIGLKYVWGGTSLTSGADCSGYVQSVLAQFGIKVPRVTYDQINTGNKISFGDLQAGDMVFFDTNTKQSGPDHVGIYIGGGKFIHSPRPGSSVQISSITDGYYGRIFMGGRRANGMEGGGKDSVGGDGANPTAPRLSPEAMAAEYGWAYSFLQSNAELNSVFQTAVAETWTTQKFQAKLRETNWWKTNGEAARAAQLEASTDPATFAAKVQASGMKVRMLASEMGAILPEEMFNKIGEDVIRTGMTDAELKHSLGKYITFTEEGTLAGQAGMAELRLKQLAYANGVQMSSDSIKNYAQMIAMGVSTMEQAEQQVRNMAKSMFPTFGEQIDAGINLMDIANPYAEIAAEELELPRGTMDLTSPMVKQGMNGLNADGKPYGMSLTDYRTFVRSDPRWNQTQKAQKEIMRVGSDILREMGVLT